MVMSESTGAIRITALPADHPAAPKDHSAWVLTELEEAVQSVLNAAKNQDKPRLTLTQGYPVQEEGADGTVREGVITLTANEESEADSIEEAVNLLMDAHVLAHLGSSSERFETFTVDYRPNETEHYPLFMFAFDSLDQMNGRMWGGGSKPVLAVRVGRGAPAD